jgi:hypothetical protein
VSWPARLRDDHQPQSLVFGDLLREGTSSLALFDRVFEYLDIIPDIADAPDATDLPATALGDAARLAGPGNK